MAKLTTAEWRSLAESTKLRTQPLLGGEPINLGGEFSNADFSPINPATGAALPAVAMADQRAVDHFVAAARRAFDDGRWSNQSPAARGVVLKRFADLIEANAAELAVTISLEMGKPAHDALAVEVRAIANCIRYYGELGGKLADESPAVGPDALALVTREPAGVVAAVLPWNFPLTLAGWKIGPALLAGNSLIVKPAEQTPFSILRVAELALDAGLPADVFTVLPGTGDIAGAALGRHHDVDVLTFTGSTEVGRMFQRYAAESNNKRVWLELGGKSASVVLPDADLEKAARTAAWGAFYNQGEMCSASSRLVVLKPNADTVIECAVEQARAMSPSDPLQDDAALGAMVSAEHAANVQRHLDRALDDGAEVAGSGTLPSNPPSGSSFLAPHVLIDVDPKSTAAQDEIFGPVLSVIRVNDVDEAIRVANDTRYGLAASLWTRDLDNAVRLSRRLRAGSVWVNCYEEGDMNMPFGGVKGSGYGRDKSIHALDKFTDLKSTWIALGGNG